MGLGIAGRWVRSVTGGAPSITCCRTHWGLFWRGVSSLGGPLASAMADAAAKYHRLRVWLDGAQPARLSERVGGGGLRSVVIFASQL